MKIMDHLERTLGSIVVPEIGKGGAAELFSQIEMEIRAGIAAELEDLVQQNRRFYPHGLPTEVTKLDCTTYIPPSLFGNIQQEFFRAAAMCVLGKGKATPDDWHMQAEAMRRRAAEADRKAQIDFELAEERKRERSL